MTSKLDKIRAILAEQEAAKNRQGSFESGPSAVFPFWKMEVGNQSLVRFLPDGNSKNPLMYVESQQIWLSFPGIKGETPNPVKFKVPCVETWGLSCPILGHIRKEGWFKDKDTEPLGRQYWKKRSWIFQGLIVEDGLAEEEAPENPIRRFIVGNQLFQQIREGLIDPDLDESPDDYDAGYDFFIKVTQQAGTKYNNYTSSKFRSAKPRSLSEDERDAIEKYGLSDLSMYQPKKPSDEELAEIYDLFMSSINGDLYDAEKFGHLPWRPQGVGGSKDTTVTTRTATVVSPGVEVAVTDADDAPDPAPVAEVKESDGPVTADEILAKLRANKS